MINWIKEHKSRYITMGFIMVVILLIVVCICQGKKDDHILNGTEAVSATETFKMYGWSDDENEKRIQKYDWVKEVSYDGTKNLSSELFKMAFRTSENDYIPNVKMEETYGSELLNNVSSETAAYLEKLYGSSYREVMGDKEGFIGELEGYWYNGSELFYETRDMDDTEDYVDDESYHRTVSEWYIDNAAVLECQVSTDPCMVYENEYQLVCRAEIAIIAHDISDKAIESFKKITGMELKDNETVYYIVETSMTMDRQCIGLEIMYEAEH